MQPTQGGNDLTVLIFLMYSGVSGICGLDLPHSTCERNYDKVGGFIERNDRVMPEMLVNDRDCSSDKNDGHKLDWNKFEQSIHR